MSTRAIEAFLACALVSGLVTAAGARPRPAPADRGLVSIYSPHVFDESQRIDINQISMVVTNTGSIAWDKLNGAAGLEFPKGSGKTALFAAGPWLGASVGGQVRVAISEYSDEYGPGAMFGGVSDDHARPEYKVYKLQRAYPSTAERDAALLDYNAGAVPHGAPLVSVLGDGTLSIPGDQMLWCVFNDADPAFHTNAAGSTLPLGVEVQLTAFAYSQPDPGGPATRTIVLRYKFVNRGVNTLQDLWIGMWSDPDLGGFTDDLIGCDAARGMGYVYNGGGPDLQYGATPPALGFDLLRGPVGAGGVPLGMTAFTRYVNGGEPASATGTYAALRGLEPSGAPVIDPTTGLPTTFSVTGDPITGTGWIDKPPSDRRMLLSSGPVDLSPGQSEDVEYAIVIGQGNNRLSSVLSLRCDDDAIQEFFDRSYSLPLPDAAACPQLVNCPRPAAYWYDQITRGGGEFTPGQLDSIAQRVDAASLYFDWGADPLGNLRAALDPAAGSSPRANAIREFAGFRCNVAVSEPVILPAGGQRIFLDAGTPIDCSGLAGGSIGELARTAVIGLSDASYLDVGPSSPALVGVDSGLPLWGGAAGYAADLFGSSIPSGSPNTHTVEIRFTGGAMGQYAYRYLRTLDGGGNRVYFIQDYVPVPFQIWDTDSNVQLNAAFLENAGPPQAPNMNGVWDPDDSPQGGREILWVMDSAYSGDATPNPNYFNDPGLQDILGGQVDLRYVMWPRLFTAGAFIDNGDRFRFTWGGITPGPGVDGVLIRLAALAPGDPAADLGYGDVDNCLRGINAGVGIGVTCDVPTPTLISLVDAAVAPDRVTVTWYLGGDAASRMAVERRVDQAGWMSAGDVAPDGRGLIVFEDEQVAPGHTYGYRLRWTGTSGVQWGGETSVLVPLHGVLSLEGFHPNPAGRTPQLAFSLASHEPATLTLFDVAGRQLLSREVGALGPGPHVIPLDGGGSLPSGIYLLHLRQGGRSVTRRAIAIR
jgi:hypothetical protein